MRLIDADKLKADNPLHMGQDVPYCTEETVEEIIDNAPTVEVVPLSVIEDIVKGLTEYREGLICAHKNVYAGIVDHCITIVKNGGKKHG